ncbi:MAG: metallophosphoesterase [Bacilli bacterium]|nr:metallophosphoesterase [Bacilli bacterium]
MSNNRFSIKKRLLMISALSFSLALAACSNSKKESSSEKKEESSPAPASVSSEVSSSSIIESSSIEESSEVSSSEESISSLPPEESYNIVRPEFTPDYDNYGLSGAPSGVNLTYYSDIYSRGLSWITDTTAEETELYLIKSDKGAEADFDDANLYYGETLEVSYDTSGYITAEGLEYKKGSGNTNNVTLMSHKVHVENLEKGKAYSYKIGSEEGYAYGAFIVEKDDPEEIQAIHMSDAQTKDLSKTNVWRNTFKNAVETAGDGLDMALYNGDQFDQNNSSGNDKEPFRFYRFLKAYDVISDYKFNLPYMASSGNHEPSSPYSNYLTGDIDYAGFDYKGTYYSYDYSFAHFVVLNTNNLDEAQINWLKEDLEEAEDMTWKIVMLHISPYSSGDHSNDTENQQIVEKLTPIFSEYHVDLVLQAHDHTYNKTKAYRWDAAGYTTTYDNDEVVNLDPDTETIDGITYDKNPEGTYYVTTGAAGHRCGDQEKDGIWAEVTYDDGGEAQALNPSKTFLNNKYKIEMGALKYETQYAPYTFSGYTSDQHYEIGDLATGNVNAQMFGVLNLTKTTLSYNVYTVKLDLEPQIFDSLDILKA